MSKEILVAMKPQDRIQDMIPCLEGVAQPGMKVVFLLRYPVGGFIRPQEPFGREAVLEEAKKLTKHYSWEENVKRAEMKVSPAFEVLRRKGAEVTVHLYAGSLKRAIRCHVPEGGVNLIMIRGGIRQWIATFFNGTNSIFRLFKRPSFSPVLLIRPRTLL
jgi:hypothetical protein